MTAGALALAGACVLGMALPNESHGQEPAGAASPAPMAPGRELDARSDDAPGPAELVLEGEPIDDATRREQAGAGLLGLSGWTVLGVLGGLWLALRWRRTRRS